MISIDHADSSRHAGTYAESSVTWEVPLPGYSLDSGVSGEREADVSGYVMPDGEIEDFEAVDASTGEVIDLPASVESRADAALIEAAARNS